MGYDERHQSNSSGAAITIVVAVLIVAVLGIVVVGGAAVFWVRTAKVEAMVAQERTVAELHRVGIEAQNASADAQLEQARDSDTRDSRLNFELYLDRDGNTNVDGEKIGLDELKARLSTLKNETSNVFVVHINAAPECLAKHIVPVLDVCHDVGDIDYRVVLSQAPDPSAKESDAKN